MQIVSFLQQNAHPRVAEKIPTVPENVTDQVLDFLPPIFNIISYIIHKKFKFINKIWNQIRLWEADLNRVEMTPAHLYDEFPSRVCLLLESVFCTNTNTNTNSCTFRSSLTSTTSAFVFQDVFEAACDFAREYGGLLWENSKKMRLVVKAEIFTQMKEFLRRQKQ